MLVLNRSPSIISMGNLHVLLLKITLGYFTLHHESDVRKIM
jgi:hypothetical protein